MIYTVLSVAILGCSSLRKSATNKPAPSSHPTGKDTISAGDQESADSVKNLLSTLNKPLILANGIEISVHVLADMKVEDILNFSIYTDADAIKAYGERGTGGVIDIKSTLSKRELRKRVKADNIKRNIKR